MTKLRRNFLYQFYAILVIGCLGATITWYKMNPDRCGFEILLIFWGMSICLIYWVNNYVFATIKQIKEELKNISEGNPLSTHSVRIANPEIVERLSFISSTLFNATLFARNLGRETVSQQALDTSLPLNTALIETELQLSKLKQEEEKRNWVIKGVASLGDIIHQNLNSQLDELADLMISKMVKHLGANQGGFYLVEQELDESFIRLVSCYAFDRKKYVAKKLIWGEGLVGECIRDQDLVYLTDIPLDYIRITSGLGDASPRNIVICPLKTNDKTIGAIEIASFELMGEHKIELIRKVCESLASTVVTMQNNWKNLELLKQAELTEQTLREKEIVLLQNAEELTATQEELNRKLVQIEQESNLNQNILTAINKSNAMVEYDMEGRMTDANELYLSMMGYKKEEVIGKTDSFLLTKEDSSLSNFGMLWDSLRQGKFNSGQYKRLSKNGGEVWIEASFSPILDLQGRPFKVLMLAQFITDILAKENELKNKIHALNEVLPYAELDFELKIKNCNALFMQLFGLTRKASKEFYLVTYLKQQGILFENPKKVFELYHADQKSIKNAYELTLPNGSTHRMAFCNSPLRDLNGNLTGFGLTIQELPENGVFNGVVNLKAG